MTQQNEHEDIQLVEECIRYAVTKCTELEQTELQNLKFLKCRHSNYT